MFQELLINTLARFRHEFKDNELAYLALTSKIELPFRDRLAFSLHGKVSPSFVVSREWQRTDLAILENSLPRVLVEFKAMYTFDALLPKNLFKFAQKIENDERKLEKLAEKYPKVETYNILLATHPHARIEKNCRAIKYSRDINKAYKGHRDSKEIIDQAQKAVKEVCENKSLIDNDIVRGGSAFSIQTDVLSWIIKG